MEHKLQTIANGKIIISTVSGDMSLEDWQQASIEILDAINATDGHIHVIVDMLNMDKHPVNVIQLKKATVWGGHRRIRTISHLITSRPVIILGDTVIAMTMGAAYKAMDSLQAAFERITREDDTIQESPQELLTDVNAGQR